MLRVRLMSPLRVCIHLVFSMDLVFVLVFVLYWGICLNFITYSCFSIHVFHHLCYFMLQHLFLARYF